MLLLRCSVMKHAWPTGLCCPWGFSRQEHWSGLPCPAPKNLPNPGIESRYPTLQANSLLSESQGKPKDTGLPVYPFSSVSSWPMDRTRVSCIADGFFTSWATRNSNSKNGSDTQTSPGARERDKIIRNKMSHYFWVVKNEYASVYYTSVCVEMYAFMEGVKGPWCESL